MCPPCSETRLRRGKSGTKAVTPRQRGQDVTRIGGIFFQLATKPRDVCVDRTTAYRGTGPPDLAQQLHPGCDGAPPPHEGQQQPEFGVSDPDRLSVAKNGL